jgi:hypothetical protein
MAGPKLDSPEAGVPIFISVAAVGIESLHL